MIDSITLDRYRQTMMECMTLYYPNANTNDIIDAIDYSIEKRYFESNARIENSYKKKEVDMTLLALADYINSREPIITGFGTIFSKHETVPNPLAIVVQEFLDNRSAHKDMMFKYPKGSEMFERYNLMQQLDKIDVNGQQ